MLSVAFEYSVYGQVKKTEIVRDSVVDNRDGRVYKMIKIGNKTWMTENLKWECQGSFLYDDIAKNLKKYGLLYTYDASRNACPAGTHLPRKQDWDSLAKVADPKEMGIAGDRLMKKTNPGFAAIMGGYRNGKGKYIDMESIGCYWGANNTVSFNVVLGGVNFYIGNSFEKDDYKNSYSIRCVKD